MNVAAVVRGEFLYRDVLLVDCGGELKRHARASEAEIQHLLNGVDGGDQVGHWWQAQLIHYGLPRSKHKDTCKVRLQQALNQGKLKIQPPHLTDMEAQMKKEYATAIRKASNKANAAHTVSTKGTKRAREEEGRMSSKKTKITVHIGEASVDSDISTTMTPKKVKSSREKATPAAKLTTSTPSLPSSSKTKWKGDPRDHPDNVFQQSSSIVAADTPKTKSKPRKAKAEIIKEEKMVKNEPSDQDEEDEMDTRPDISQDQLNVTGVYNLQCTALALQAPDHAERFRLFMCVDNDAGRIWGAFELAWKSGHIKIDNIAYNTPLTLGWRARDYASGGSLRFGKGCCGDIEFFGRDQVRGTLYNLFPETLQFEGERRPGPLWCGRSAYKLQQEWDGYPREAYGR